jgi:hypothetical protein
MLKRLRDRQQFSVSRGYSPLDRPVGKLLTCGNLANSRRANNSDQKSRFGIYIDLPRNQWAYVRIREKAHHSTPPAASISCGQFIGFSAAGLWDYTNVFATTFMTTLGVRIILPRENVASTRSPSPMPAWLRRRVGSVIWPFLWILIRVGIMVVFGKSENPTS